MPKALCLSLLGLRIANPLRSPVAVRYIPALRRPQTVWILLLTVLSVPEVVNGLVTYLQTVSVPCCERWVPSPEALEGVDGTDDCDEKNGYEEGTIVTRCLSQCTVVQVERASMQVFEERQLRGLTTW